MAAFGGLLGAILALLGTILAHLDALGRYLGSSGLLGAILARLRALGRHLAGKDVATQLQHAPRQVPKTSFSVFSWRFWAPSWL